jgi:elongation factor P
LQDTTIELNPNDLGVTQILMETGMKASKMKKGQTVMIDDKLCVILDYQHVKLGKGDAAYQTKFKSLVDGSIINKRIRVEDNLEEAYLDNRDYEYLYSSGNEHILMDCENYAQISLDSETFGDSPQYLKPNTRLQVSMYHGKPVVVTLPNTVDLEVAETVPEIRGATATKQYKPATLETGLTVQVPSFIKVGEKIRVDTRTGEYVTRVKE